jgi:hypothetical protein
MTWTRTQQLRALMRVPWTVLPERNDEDGYLVARVTEVPDAIATGADAPALGRDLWAALWSSLAAPLEYGDAIPLPPGVRALPWEDNSDAPRKVVEPVGLGPAWDSSGGSAGGFIGA